LLFTLEVLLLVVHHAVLGAVAQQLFRAIVSNSCVSGSEALLLAEEGDFWDLLAVA